MLHPTSPLITALILAEPFITFFCDLLTGHAGILLQIFLDMFLEIPADGYHGTLVCPTVFRYDPLDHTETLQILGCDIHDFTGFSGTVGILPLYRSKTFGRQDRVCGIFHHPYLIAYRRRQRPTAAAFSNKDT